MNNIDQNEGYLKLIIGPMYSGKTSSLIHIYNTYRHHFNILVINHSEDVRYGKQNMSTHDGIKIPCIFSSDLSCIENIQDYDMILINEGQFFSNLRRDVLSLVEQHKKHVYIAALDGDFKREPFGEILDLIPYCDKIKKIHALCRKCKNGKPALFSHRLSKEKEVKVIGNTNYESLCRKCYIQENIEQLQT